MRRGLSDVGESFVILKGGWTERGGATTGRSVLARVCRWIGNYSRIKIRMDGGHCDNMIWLLLPLTPSPFNCSNVKWCHLRKWDGLRWIRGGIVMIVAMGVVLVKKFNQMSKWGTYNLPTASGHSMSIISCLRLTLHLGCNLQYHEYVRILCLSLYLCLFLFDEMLMSEVRGAIVTASITNNGRDYSWDEQEKGNKRRIGTGIWATTRRNKGKIERYTVRVEEFFSKKKISREN